jgi:NADPH2:quinone reductase
VVGVLLSYNEASLPMRRFGVQPNPISLGPKVNAALSELVATGKIRPVVGRRIGMSQVAATLEDHAQRRTMGRSVVDLSLE